MICAGAAINSDMPMSDSCGHRVSKNGAANPWHLERKAAMCLVVKHPERKCLGLDNVHDAEKAIHGRGIAGIEGGVIVVIHGK